ncbi:hypothetical protein [Methanothrix sp.]|uniref:hypothetical protein n=1 Tax=Methanothrix sp. TaxID=90426 RepID=UPI0026000CF4|nr:hypothetical protein [Methanothrix sp.]
MKCSYFFGVACKVGVMLKLYAFILIVFAFINAAFGAIGDGGVQGYSDFTPLDSPPAMGGQGYPQSTQYPGSQPQSTNSQLPDQQPWSSLENILGGFSAAPEVQGPYAEQMTPTDLKLQEPSAESFQPDGSLDFSSATPPAGLSFDPSGVWRWPGSLTSRNRLYVQTSSGLKTVGGCQLGGYLPLWAQIASAGNLYTYEWYPSSSKPKVRWWGWSWPGFKRGWFYGDSPGWHILSYYCNGWSNYVYIYVWPSSVIQSNTNIVQSVSNVQNSNVIQSFHQGSESSIQGAPTPPDVNTEQLILPDSSKIYPGCSGDGCYADLNPVFPRVASCRCPEERCGCNAYYIQIWPNKLVTAAGVVQGEWLPLWSHIRRPGKYWSYEWAPCGSFPRGYYCSPSVKCFGYKSAGWFPTWFYGEEIGWHILAYCTTDWSNYIYIYVWPGRGTSKCHEFDCRSEPPITCGPHDFDC